MLLITTFSPWTSPGPVLSHPDRDRELHPGHRPVASLPPPAGNVEAGKLAGRRRRRWRHFRRRRSVVAQAVHPGERHDDGGRPRRRDQAVASASPRQSAAGGGVLGSGRSWATGKLIPAFDLISWREIHLNKWGSIRRKQIVRWRYLSRMKNDEYFYSPEKCFGWCNATGYHPGPVAPPCADGAPFE